MCGNEIKPLTLASPVRAFISIAMYPAICSYDEQAFDNMRKVKKKKKKKLSLRNHCSLFQSMVEQAKKHGGFIPQ